MGFTLILLICWSNPDHSTTMSERFLQTGVGKRTLKWAHRDNPHAQLELAKVYFHADEKESYENAFYWFEQAAENGSIEAIYYQARMYAEGWSVTQDRDRAVQLYTQAAEGGYHPAYRALLRLMLEVERFEEAEDILQDWEGVARPREKLQLAEIYRKEGPLYQPDRATTFMLEYYQEYKRVLPLEWSRRILERIVELGASEAQTELDEVEHKIWLRQL